MSTTEIVKLLLSMSDLIVTGLDMVVSDAEDATEEERNAAVGRLQTTSEAVRKRLADIEAKDK